MTPDQANEINALGANNPADIAETSGERANGVIHACWACGGSGFRLKSVGPIRFKPCWACYGRRGRVGEAQRSNTRRAA